MKPQVVVFALFLFGTASLLDAQQKTTSATAPGDNVLGELPSATSPKSVNSVARSSQLAARDFLAAAAPAFSAIVFPVTLLPNDARHYTEIAGANASPRASAPGAAQTRSRAGDDSRHRLELAFGYNFVRFRSAPITANMNGLNSSLAYYPWSHVGIEANTTAAFGSEIFNREHTKFLFYGGGLRYVEPYGAWEPWAHILVGGVHMLPQTSAGGQNSFGIKAGGGIDYNWPRQSILWFRVEGNYIRSQLYSTGQNNFMISGGVVFRLAPI
jgi:hypothetical protein